MTTIAVFNVLSFYQTTDIGNECVFKHTCKDLFGLKLNKYE